MISIIYTTKRPGGIDLLFHCLKRQSYRDFEVLIVDELYRDRRQDLYRYKRPFWFQDSVYHIQPPSKKHFRNICASLNAGLRRAIGDLVVLIQDYIWFPENALERFDAVSAGQNLVSGICHHIENPSEEINLAGLISIYEPQLIAGWDARLASGKKMRGMLRALLKKKDVRLELTGDKGVVFASSYQAWETNFAAIPTKILKELGGWDEAYDQFKYGYDNQDVSFRAEKKGYKCLIDTDNVSFQLPHHEYFPFEPGEKEDGEACKEYHLERMKQYEAEPGLREEAGAGVD